MQYKINFNNFKSVVWFGIIYFIFSMFMIVLEAAPKKIELKLDEKKLLSGELQTFESEYAADGDSKKKRVIGVILLDAAPEEVWKVVSDWERVPKYLPSLDYYKIMHVVNPAGEGCTGRYLIEGKISASFLSFVYNLDVKFDKKSLSQSWKMIQDNDISVWRGKGVMLNDSSKRLKNIEGFSYIEPYAGGTKSLFYYVPILQVSGPVPAFIEKALTKSSLGDYMKGLRNCFKK